MPHSNAAPLNTKPPSRAVLCFGFSKKLLLQLLQNLLYHVALIFQMLENCFNFFFRFRIDLKIRLGSRLGVFALQVLPYKKQRHEKELNQVGNEKPEDESRKGVKGEFRGCQKIPSEPQYGPQENRQKKAHRADVVGNPHGKTLKFGQPSPVLNIYVSDGLSGLFQCCERKRLL